MANHKSAAKRARQSVKRQAHHSMTKKAVRTIEKKLRTAMTAKDSDLTQTLLRSYTSKIAKAAQKGIVHVKTASRKISRLTSQANSISK